MRSPKESRNRRLDVYADPRRNVHHTNVRIGLAKAMTRDRGRMGEETVERDCRAVSLTEGERGLGLVHLEGNRLHSENRDTGMDAIIATITETPPLQQRCHGNS
jgi:hypothetical protein